jgi:outer membrane protein TolC
MLDFDLTRKTARTATKRPLRFLAALTLAVGAALPLPAFCQIVPAAPTRLPTPLTLSDAIAIALRQQPQQYIARDQVTQAQGQKQQARSQYFPTLTPTYQYQNRSQSLFGVTTGSSTSTIGTGTTGTGTGIGTGTGTTGTGTGTGTTGTGTTGTGATGTGTGTTGTTTTVVSSSQSINEVNFVRGGGLTVALSQTLFDSGARETINAQARRALDAANFNSANTRQATILTVTQDYYQLLLALDLVKVAQAQVARYQQAVDVTQAQIQAGTVAAKEVYQAQADLANAQVTLIQDQNQVQLTSAALKNALGVATDATVQPAPLAAGDQLPPLPTAGQALTLDAALQTAYSSRPDLRQQQATVASQNAALQQARRAAGLTLRGDYVLSYQATNDVGTRGVDSQFLVTGSYPVFDAGSVRGAIRIAQAQRDVALNQLEQVRQQIRLDTEQAYNTRATNLQAAGLAQAAVTSAQVNYDAAVAAHREGIGTVLDITTAQATLTQAQNQYVVAIYNFYTADAQLQRALGRNDASLPPAR